jgi:NADPH-dependent 2,4-dienoyl-CoA reductase/sulfur reductase-like enzyme/ferredoxin
LLIIVASRKLIYNDSADATASFIISVFVLAFIGGVIFKGKSGWCSNLCPMLPIERLYGQTPFFLVRNSHCKTCVACTKNCYDFNPGMAALADHYDEDRHYSARRKFFAGALPGLIYAYYTLPSFPDIQAQDLYLQFALHICVSVGLFFTLDAYLNLKPNQLPALFGAIALNLFYWFTLPSVIARWGGDAEAPATLWSLWTARLALFALALAWLARAFQKETRFVSEMLPSLSAQALSFKARTAQLAAPGGYPTITIWPDQEEAQVAPGLTLLSCLEQQGRGIEAGCRMGVCGADPVAVLTGMENLSPASREELSTLQRLGWAENTRMACCARVHGAVAISLTPERPAAPAKPVGDFRCDPTVESIVIIGAGIAGVTAADHIRRRNPSCQIHLVGRERHYLYNRMGISRLIYGRSAMQGLYLLPESWYEEHRITCWINTQAVAIDRAARQVRLATGEALAYDRLILAMGGASQKPPIDGFGLAGTFVLRGADDAMKIRAFAQQHECHHAIIAGGGLLGLEAAYALHKFGLRVTVLERSEKLLARQLDCRGAQILRDCLERMGMDILLKAEIASVLGQGQFADLLLDMPALKEFFGERAQGGGRVNQILLKDGRILPCDVFLAAVGMAPNSELAREAGLEVRQGVVVDQALRSSDPHIFAVGDVAEFQRQIPGLWPTAVDQAEIAAINSLGGGAVYSASAQVALLKVAGIDLLSVGRIEPESEEGQVLILEETVPGSEQRRYRKLVVEAGKITGAILIGYPIDAPAVIAAIKRQVEVTPLLSALRAGDWGGLSQWVGE